MTLVEPAILFVAFNLVTASAAGISFGWVMATTVIASPLVAFAILGVVQWTARATADATRLAIVLTSWIFSLGTLALLTGPQIAAAAFIGLVAPFAIFFTMTMIASAVQMMGAIKKPA